MDDLYEIISEVFEIDVKDINGELGPDDIETWDSLGQLRLITSLESYYKITFEIAEIFEIFKVGDIIRLLKNRKLV
ncbi:MAG: acyl carrier protein [bacterium]